MLVCHHLILLLFRLFYREIPIVFITIGFAIRNFKYLFKDFEVMATFERGGAGLGSVEEQMFW